MSAERMTAVVLTESLKSHEAHVTHTARGANAVIIFDYNHRVVQKTSMPQSTNNVSSYAKWLRALSEWGMDGLLPKQFSHKNINKTWHWNSWQIERRALLADYEYHVGVFSTCGLYNYPKEEIAPRACTIFQIIQTNNLCFSISWRLPTKAITILLISTRRALQVKTTSTRRYF